MRRIAPAGLALLLASVGNVHAGCREDVQAMLKAGEEARNYRIATETIMGGAAVQHSEQAFRDYSHFRQHVKETGVHLLVLGTEEYMSSDGTSWKPWQTREADWLETTLERNARLRDTIRDTECGTEEIDGVSYRRLRHVQETTEPMESVSDVVTHVDPATGRPAYRHMKTRVGGQEIEMKVRYFWDEAVELPQP